MFANPRRRSWKRVIFGVLLLAVFATVVMAVTCWVDPSRAFLISPSARHPLGPVPCAVIAAFCVIPGILLIVSGLTGRSLRSRMFPNRPPDLPNYYVGLSFLILSLPFLVLAIRESLEWQRMRHWVIAPAQVLWSGVTPPPSTSREMRYSVVVFYRYLYGGAEYRSNCFNPFETRWSSHAKVSDFVSTELPPGKTLSVYVDPGAPQSAVIDRAASGIVPLYAMFVVCGAVGFSGMRHRRWRGSRARLRALKSLKKT